MRLFYGSLSVAGFLFPVLCFGLHFTRRGRNRLDRVLCCALCNMGNFRFYLGLTDHSNSSHGLDEVGVQPFENDRFWLALHSNFRCGNLLCATDISFST